MSAVCRHFGEPALEDAVAAAQQRPLGDRFGGPIEYFPRWRLLPKNANANLFGTTGARSFALTEEGDIWQTQTAAPPPEPQGCRFVLL